MPPSLATRHAPLPLGVAAIPTTGALRLNGAIEADAIGASLACAARAGNMTAVEAIVTSVTAMRAKHLDACRLWCTGGLPHAGIRGLVPTTKGSAGERYRLRQKAHAQRGSGAPRPRPRAA